MVRESYLVRKRFTIEVPHPAADIATMMPVRSPYSRSIALYTSRNRVALSFFHSTRMATSNRLVDSVLIGRPKSSP
jgi:hypothetical protein